MICTVDKPSLLHETIQYIILNPSAGRAIYTNNDKSLSEGDDKTKRQQPKGMEQGVIKQQPEEVKQIVNKEPVEKVKQSDKMQLPGSINQGDITQQPGNIDQSDKTQSPGNNQGNKTQPPGNINRGDITQLPGNINQGDKTQSPRNINQIDKTQPPGNINQGDKKQQSLPAVTDNPIKGLLNLVGTNNGGMYNSYLKKLSASQINSVIDQLGVTNLTLQKSQIKFLSCGGKRLLKKLKAKQFNISLNISPDFHHCKNMSFKSSGPTVALASYPGSGNSWVRQLLESATGIYTGAIYCDQAYVGAGMIGEFIDTRNVLAIKTHSPPSTGLLGQYNKVIYVVRNPFSAILAEHNRQLAASAPKLYGDSHTAEINYKYGMYTHTYTHIYCM